MCTLSEWEVLVFTDIVKDAAYFVRPSNEELLPCSVPHNNYFYCLMVDKKVLKILMENVSRCGKLANEGFPKKLGKLSLGWQESLKLAEQTNRGGF